MTTIRIAVQLILVALFAASCGQANKELAHPYVNDNINLLTTAQTEKLTTEIVELQNTIGSQIFILIIDTLNGEKIDDYAFKIANEWGIGRKNYDDGILIVVSKSDRAMRIEVGLGLEKIIKDEIAAEIIRENLVPNFREEKYYDGLYLAVSKIKSLIKDNKALVGQH
jgi:uncharacterized membrane protein YgcG